MDNHVDKVEKLRNLHKNGHISENKGGRRCILPVNGETIFLCGGKFMNFGKRGLYSRLKKAGQTHIMNKETNILDWEVLSHQLKGRGIL